MSDLQRSFARQKLGSLPAEPPIDPNTIHEDIESEEESDNVAPLPTNHATVEDDSSSASSASSVSSAGTIRPPPRSGRSRRTDESAYSPIPWHSSFHQILPLSYPHGAFIYNTYYTPPATPKAPLFILVHGAGCSGLSFAACAQHLKALSPEIGILAPDARGHGLTEFRDEFGDDEITDGRMDMSLERMADDLEDVIELLKQDQKWDVLPNIVLVGHSLGGAVVTEVAARGKFSRKVLAFAVLDVVEGSAVDALVSMNAYLSSRPQLFASLEEGVEWHIRSRTIRNSESARISVPSYLKPIAPSTGGDETSKPQRYQWITDLTYTSPYWENWFTGMSSKFLSSRGGKLLLLAGTDRLDKELMIGQMQGKYQLQVFPDAGHFVQEDVPEKTARTLIDFWKRNDGSAIVLPPKVGAKPAA